MVGILILVHQDIAETPLILLQNIRIILEELYRPHQKIIEIHGIVILQLCLVFRIDIRDPSLPEIARGSGLELRAGNQLIFRRRNPGKNSPVLIKLRVQIHLF